MKFQLIIGGKLHLLCRVLLSRKKGVIMGSFKNPDVWKQNLAYQIGDFVLYSGTVYMAIKPVPAGTAMSADYWYAFVDGAVVPTTEGSITANGTYNVEMWKTAEVNVEGGGGSGETFELAIYEGYQDQPLSTAYFTAEDSSGSPLTITPHSDEETSWFTIEIGAGNMVVLKAIADSGYNFNTQSSMYVLDDVNEIIAPISAQHDAIKFIAASNEEFPEQGFGLMLASGDH